MKTEDLKNYIFEQLNETSPERATALAKARDTEGREASAAMYLAAKQAVRSKKNPKLDQNKIEAMNSATVQFMDLASEKFSKGLRAWNRSLGRRGDGSPRTPKQESAFNFINGLKRLQEAKKFPPITIEELKSPDATKHHARRGVKHPDPKVAIEALNLGFRLKDAKTAWMGKDHPDQEVQDTAQMSLNMHED